MKFLFAMFLLFACSSSNVVQPPNLTPPANNDGALAKNAKDFDDYVHGKLSPDAVTALKKECTATPQQNIFCSTMERGEALDKRIQNLQRVVHPPEMVKRTIVPVVPNFVRGKAKNWLALRQAKIESLLKGLGGTTYDQLVILQKRALTDNRCPNHIAVAVAAKLED